MVNFNCLSWATAIVLLIVSPSSTQGAEEIAQNSEDVAALVTLVKDEEKPRVLEYLRTGPSFLLLKGTWRPGSHEMQLIGLRSIQL